MLAALGIKHTELTHPIIVPKYVASFVMKINLTRLSAKDKTIDAVNAFLGMQMSSVIFSL